jgi:restriction endonuclease S subunit
MRQLSALPVLVPSMKEQKEYATFVAQVDKSKQAHEYSGKLAA